MAKNKITVQDVKDAQDKWANLIIDQNAADLAKLYAKSGDNWYRDNRLKTEKCVLAFNPTLDDSFLTTNDQALHYFKGTDEKPGFAKKGWLKVIFDPKEHPKAQRFITITGDGAVAVGRYVFEIEDVVLDSVGNQVLADVRLAVDYTFVYKLVGGDLIIIAHHSSLPLAQKTVK
jgi:hypothetical protein